MKQNLTRRHWLILAALCFSFPALALPVDKSRPLRILVPYAAGGSSDAVMRALALQMETILGRSVVIENRTGGQGVIAAAVVASAASDGLTLLLAGSSIVQIPFLQKELPDYLPQLKPVSQVIMSPQALGVSPNLRINTLAEFLREAAAKPGALSVGTVSTLGLALATLLKADAHVDITLLSYRGEAQALPDVLGGHLSGMIGSPNMMQRNGLKVLGLAAPQRTNNAPDVPTFGELGFPRAKMTGWLGLFAPVGTNAADIAEIERAIVVGLKSPDVLERVGIQGMEPVPGGTAAFNALIASELDFWATQAEILNLGTK